ncbi:sensor histidine kinase [Nonomuraea sp. SYSU D8015]|uniref:sensor histidine kinase n=1 Tax=Nonomuraea sp. SYSU D8015 TaxID=2593644 RepID=UPI00166081E1|nr:sensor histidine kinase [Nonomuraea sp. SYSU D8015]
MRVSRTQVWDCVAAAVAVPLFVFGTEVASRTRVPPFRALDVLAYALLVVSGLALATRSRSPSGLLGVMLACCAAMLARHHAYGPIFLGLYVALASVVIRYGLRHGLAAVGVSGTVLLAADMIGWGRMWVADDVGAWTIWYASSLLPFVAGAMLRMERDRRASAARADEERRLRRFQDERLAVAREVHDVVGHSLSVISMRAGVALHVAHRRPEQALEALEAIRTTSKEALDELRTALDILKDRQSRPGPERIEGLVESIRTAGQSVSLTVHGDPTGLPATMGHIVYRTVQEALTNVVRHANAATATVMIDYGRTEVIVEVTDDGTGQAGAAPGNGIAGMRERVTALHGTLTAGPRAEGGFAVHARLPRTGTPTARTQPPAAASPGKHGGREPKGTKH